jgi:hypothetical protein
MIRPQMHRPTVAKVSMIYLQGTCTNFEAARVTQSAHPFKLGPTAVVCREPMVTDICPSGQTDETEEMEANE